MSRTISATFEAQMIGGIFSTHENATRAIEAGQNSDTTQQDVHVSFPLDDKQAKEAFLHALIKAIRSGNILMKPHDASNPLLVIKIIDDHEPGYNPDGNHQTRQLVMHTEAPLG
jgi:hypothetical protein